MASAWLAMRETRVPGGCGWFWLLRGAGSSVETAIGVLVVLRMFLLKSVVVHWFKGCTWKKVDWIQSR